MKNRNYIRKLKIGTPLECIRDVMTTDDLGFSGIVFETTGFIKGKTYEVKQKITDYGSDIRGTAYYVRDETGCLCLADHDTFKICDIE